MSNATEHTAKCLRCGRVRRFRSAAAALAAGPHGRICAMRVRLAAISEAVRGFAQAQVDKARELIADGGLIPAGRPGVFRAVSSNGVDRYLVHSATCNCPAALHGRLCYHVAGARILVASGKAGMTMTPTMTTPEFIASVAALCGENEAAVVFITRDEGLSYCIASEATARATAQGSAAEPALDDGDVLLGVAVIGRDGTLTEYAIEG